MRLSLDVLRDRVTIRDVLAAAGIDTPTRARRMRCPLHHGDNPTACVILDDDQRYYCHACGAHGDVIDLAQRLHGLTFRDAVAHVARLASIEAGALRVDPATIERTATITRRRTALRRWRDAELMRCSDAVREMICHAERVGAALAHDTDDAATWARLAAIYSQRDRVEARAAELSDPDERVWLAVLGEVEGGEDESHNHAS